MNTSLMLCASILCLCLRIEGQILKKLFQDDTNFELGLDQISRITNGHVAVPHSYPWLASLQVRIDSENVMHFCGGALIAEQWILTAAHCVLALPGKRVEVVLGAHDLTSAEGTEQRILSSKLLLDKEYNERSVNRDVGLIKLETPAQLNDNVQIVQLASDADDIPDSCVASGWGAETLDGYPSRVLQETDVNILTNDQCQAIWVKQSITNAMLCAGSGTTGICAGDSGSPLICKKNNQWLAFGISSWGAEECGLQDVPDVYTRVSTFYDLVMAVIDSDDEDDDVAKRIMENWKRPSMASLAE
ncbi:chymotrypsinogen A-like [Glandiceps talaboti]